MDLGGGDTDTKPLCRDEEGAQREGEVLDLPVRQCSDSHPWLLASCRDRKKQDHKYKWRNEFSEELGHLRGGSEQSCCPSALGGGSGLAQDASRASSWEGVSGISNRGQASGQTRETLEGGFLQAGQ